jgi:hypothetical protein
METRTHFHDKLPSVIKADAAEHCCAMMGL